jgi:hypothetical protein
MEQKLFLSQNLLNVNKKLTLSKLTLYLIRGGCAMKTRGRRRYPKVKSNGYRVEIYFDSLELRRLFFACGFSYNLCV